MWGSQDSLVDPEHATASLEFHEKAMASIDDEIESLKRTIRQLRFRKLQHEDQIKRMKGLTTLARKLPPELLAHIFEICAHSGWTRIPLTVSHVCHEWRKAAQIPTVWSHIYINCATRDPCRRTRFWLENARDSPLHITVHAPDDGPHLPGVMDLLLTRVTQWRTFSIDANLLRHVNFILTLSDKTAPELRVVDISVTEEIDEIDPVDETVQDFTLTHLSLIAPHFRTLRISSSVLPSPGSVSASITKLSITLYGRSDSSIERALQLLEGLSELRELSIALLPHDERTFRPASSDRVIHLLDLRSLVLVGSPNMFRLLGHLLTPSLSHLYLRSSVDVVSYIDEEVSSNVRSFIERTGPPLELLELYGIDLSPSDFTASFSNLPDLKQLRLHESDVTDSVIGIFMSCHGFCPLLRQLDLRWCGQVTGRALVMLVQDRLLTSRCPSENDAVKSSPISMVTVINCAFVKEEDILSLSQSTICRIVIHPGDYCWPLGCCQNERYRRRLRQRVWLRNMDASDGSGNSALIA